jgi:PAS domain S-box-containing protein
MPLPARIVDACRSAARSAPTMTSAPEPSASASPSVRPLRLALLWLGVALIFGLDLEFPLGVSTGGLYVLIVLASLSLREVGWTVALAIVATILTMVDVAVSPPGDTDLWIVRVNRVISVVAIWTTVGIGVWLLREQAARQETERSLSETSWRLLVQGESESQARNAATELEQRVAERTADLVRARDGLREQVLRRVESEERALRSERVLRSIFDTAAEAIVTIDTRGLIESVNRAAERMFGWTAEELVGRNVSLLMPAPNAEQHDDYIRRYLGTGQPRVIGIGREVVGLRKDGSTFPLDLSVGEFVADEGRKFTGILRDLTERKRLEDEFRQAQKMEAVGRLASGIAHDFNNLLAGVIGCSNMARKTLPAEAPAAQLIDEIKGAAERGASLSRQLLNFSRQRPSEPAPLELDSIVRTAANMLRQVLGDQVELELDLSPTGAPVFGDASKLEQVLMNLAINARDAMRAGGRLRITTEELELTHTTRVGPLPAGSYVRLSVQDTGAGIDPAIRERIFEPFFTTKPIGEGTGLGLYTVYALVDQMGGFVDFESELGRGTVFRILLPRRDPKLVVAPANVARAAAGASPPSGVVLIVEDERLIRVSLAHTLRARGYEVLTADSCSEAEHVAQTHRGALDLLLTDMALPGGNGRELAERLCALRPGLRVIYMSAYPAELLVSQGRLDTGVSTLEKPFTEESLDAALCAAFEDAPPSTARSGSGAG